MSCRKAQKICPEPYGKKLKYQEKGGMLKYGNQIPLRLST